MDNEQLEIIEEIETTESEIIETEEPEVIKEQETDLSVNPDETEEENENGEIKENEVSSTSEEYQITIIDYTEHFETLTEQIEYLTTTNEQLIANNMFFGSLFVSFIVCFILYKFIKIFL